MNDWIRCTVNSRIAAVLIAVIMLAVPESATAEIGTIDDVPAATLLFPYFEVDFQDSNGITTVLAITNTSFAATVAHVVLWTDWGVPTLSFDITLTGKDVQTFNMRDLFTGGFLPGGSALSQAQITELAARHTGQAIEGGMGSQQCSAFDYGDGIARGYVTVDTWSGSLTENDAGYFTQYPTDDVGYFGANGTGKATNDNVLWGEYFLADTANNFAQGDSAVHIEADGSDARVNTSGNYTFYGRYVNATAIDNREPLAHAWNIPYRGEAEETESTSIIFWRDSTETNDTVNCGATPPWFPLNHTELVVFDEQENATDTFGQNIFPMNKECGRVDVDGFDFPVPYTSGWIYFDSRQTYVDSPYMDDRSQSFIAVIHSAEGRFSTGFQATPMLSAISGP